MHLHVHIYACSASLVSLHAVMHIAPSDADLDKSHRDSDTNDDEVAMENNV